MIDLSGFTLGVVFEKLAIMEPYVIGTEDGKNAWSYLRQLISLVEQMNAFSVNPSEAEEAELFLRKNRAFLKSDEVVTRQVELNGELINVTAGGIYPGAPQEIQTILTQAVDKGFNFRQATYEEWYLTPTLWAFFS